MRTYIQKLGKSLMAPLSIIVAAGLLLGLASTLLNPLIFGDSLKNLAAVNGFVSLVNALAGALFGLLPILFCISVAIGMVREDKEIAAFSAVIGFVLFHTAIRFFLSLKGLSAETVAVDYLTGNGMSYLDAVKENSAYDTVFGIFTYRMGIFGGIITGLWTALIHNRFHQTQLPTALSFFSGKRFVPIMMTVTIPFLAVVMFFVWPVFNMAINGFGNLIQAAGLAMYRTALPENKAKVKGTLLAAALTSFATGITEPIEFAFIFISPVLWVFHAFMAGLSFLINTLLGVMIGNAGGGLIDLMLFGVLRGFQTKWYLNVLVGIGYALIYYNVFKFVIVRKNLKTPGRDTDDSVAETPSGSVEAGSLGASIMEALGGKDNIVEIDNCISRLRLVLKDTKLADDKRLKATGSLGIIRINDENIQVVYGTKVEKAAAELKRACNMK